MFFFEGRTDLCWTWRQQDLDSVDASCHFPDFRRPPSWSAPGRFPTSPGMRAAGGKKGVENPQHTSLSFCTHNGLQPKSDGLKLHPPKNAPPTPSARARAAHLALAWCRTRPSLSDSPASLDRPFSLRPVAVRFL